MASIRRTQSPLYNGATQFSFHSPSQKHLLTPSPSPSPLSKLLSNLLFFTKPPRKLSSWKKSLFRCFLFFSLGLLLGITPFNFFTSPPFNPHSFEKDSIIQRHGDGVISNENEAKIEGEGVISRISAENEAIIEGEGGISRIGDVRFLGKEVEMGEGERVRKELIVVTATYNRGMQSYYLNRLGQVLRLVKPPLLWIVVEMSVESLETAEILRKTGVMYRHLVCRGNLTDVKDRGVHQRNRALEHIELHRLDGIVYFADDDNVYSLELFESLRNIR